VIPKQLLGICILKNSNILLFLLKNRNISSQLVVIPDEVKDSTDYYNLEIFLKIKSIKNEY
jgi:hypothetical protein